MFSGTMKHRINENFFKRWSPGMAYVLGYFDGDGCVSRGYYKRKDRKSSKSVLMVRFASGSRNFLNDLSRKISLVKGLSRGSLSQNNGGYHLIYSKKYTFKLFDFMYNNVSRRGFLERKYNRFQEAFKAIGAVA